MPTKVQKFRDQALRRAVKRRCGELFEQRWGRRWDQHDRARFKFTKAEVDRDKKAAELLQMLGEILFAIDRWDHDGPETTRLLSSKLLADWYRECRIPSGRIKGLIPATLKTHRDTRSFVISRLAAGHPNPFSQHGRGARSLPRSEVVRDITVISILAGNLPKLEKGRFYTIAKVLEQEDRYTRSYMATLKERRRAQHRSFISAEPDPKAN